MGDQSDGHTNAYLHVFCIYQVRDGKFERFQNGEVDVLVSSDVASRGLDTVRVSCHTWNSKFTF